MFSKLNAKYFKTHNVNNNYNNNDKRAEYKQAGFIILLRLKLITL